MYNARLDLSESMCVMKFYNKYYEKYSKPKLNVAFVSRKHLNAYDIDIENYRNADTITTIKDIIHEDEKKGLNNYEIYLKPEDIKTTSLPIANEYLYVEKYKKEHYKDLYNPKLNFNLKLQIKQLRKNSETENPKVLKKVL